MNVLVTGSEGQLGLEIAVLKTAFPNFNFFFTNKNTLNITNFLAVENFIIENNIKTIINCAAYTNVDKAEDELFLANEINYLAVKNLGEISKKHHLKLIHISTDYVFDGNSSKAYIETDSTNPQNNYGISKLNGEKALLEINASNSIIIRTSWLYSEFKSNFVKTILKISKDKKEISVVNNQIGSPTYAKDLAVVILKIIPLINNKNTEIYHYSNTGNCSWFEFATKIVNYSNIKCKVIPVSSAQFKTKAKRPNFSLLNTKKIENMFNIEIPEWKQSLKTCLNNL
jgi:dTDP-4-dehydrorhamnose reductase